MKILLADDHELFLKGLEFIVKEMFKDAEISFAKSYLDIFAVLNNNKEFDLVLTDLAMPGADWLDAIKKIHSQLPETPIIILSAVFDREIVKKTIDCGVSGYIPKTSANAVIISAIKLVLSGGVYIPPELLRDKELDNEFEVLKHENISNFKTLTPRQIEVIKLISKGMSNKLIAFELKLSEGTVKLHVTAILKILNTTNRTGAVMEARKLGLI